MSKALKTAIGLASKGKQYPVMPLVRSEPELAAMLSKLIPGREPARFSQAGEMQPGEPNVFELRNLSERIGRDITDAETVMQVLPETELAATILISCILSPKDMMTTEVNYSAPEGSLPPDVAAALVDRLGKYFETDYNIKPLMSGWLKDMILHTGSYPVAVIPENAIDEVINNNRFIKMESLSSDINSDGSMKCRGLLGNPLRKGDQTVEGSKKASISTESFSDGYRRRSDNYDSYMTLESGFGGKPQETFTSVIDNQNLLKVPQINQKIREERVKSALGGMALEKAALALEKQKDPAKLSDRELHNLLYKSPSRQYRPIDTIVTQERLNRRTVGAPLIMHLPSEAVIPVYVPGNVKQQVGFFVLIDEDGNPLTRQNPEDIYAQMGNRMNSGGSFATAMLNKVKANISGFDCGNRQHLAYSAQVYGAMVEQDLLSRLRNGIYTNGVALANKPEVYRIMLARALAAQHTQMLFLPIELMTYFAFKFSPDGIGRSVLDEMKILSSLRSMLTFANTMAAMKNSIGRTGVAIKLDETDPDPQKTIERYMHEIARTRQQAFPIGVTSPVDLTDYMQRAAFEFSFSGHPRMPDTSVEFTEKNSTYVKPDTDLEEDLRKRSIQKFGLPAQVVDAGYEAEFATSIVTNNILISKNVISLQDQFIPLLEDHLHKVAMNDSGLIHDLRKIIETKYDAILRRFEADEEMKVRFSRLADGDKGQLKEMIIQEALYDFVMGFNVSLPRPNSVSLENQAAAFDKYMETIEKGLDYYVSTNILNADTIGDVSEHVDMVKENIKAYYARKYMAETGMLSELSELVSTDEEGKPRVDLYNISSEHAKAMGATINHFLDTVMELKNQANAAEKLRKDKDTTQGGAEATTSEVTSTSSSGGGGFGGGFGGDDLGLGGLDTGLGDLDAGLGGPTEEDQTGKNEEGGENPAGGDNGFTL
jgi:hypothetical protein